MPGSPEESDDESKLDEYDMEDAERLVAAFSVPTAEKKKEKKRKESSAQPALATISSSSSSSGLEALLMAAVETGPPSPVRPTKSSSHQAEAPPSNEQVSTPSETPPVKRGRGRPKGSKNKPKTGLPDWATKTREPKSRREPRKRQRFEDEEPEEELESPKKKRVYNARPQCSFDGCTNQTWMMQCCKTHLKLKAFDDVQLEEGERKAKDGKKAKRRKPPQAVSPVAKKVSTKQPTGAAGYFGVTESRGGKFDARLGSIRLGTYPLKTDAAYAHDQAAKASPKNRHRAYNFEGEKEYMRARNKELRDRGIEVDLDETLAFMDWKVDEMMSK